MAQITSVTSESLQAQFRRLLPSQQGFGEDLQATNVITPVIDLTAAAAGTSTPEYQAQALAFGSQTSFSISNQTTTLANTAGFWRLVGVSGVTTTTAATRHCSFEMSDGLSAKVIWMHRVTGDGASADSAVQFDLIVFLRSGDSISGQSSGGNSHLIGSYRQVADVNGNPVNPVGFTPQ